MSKSSKKVTTSTTSESKDFTRSFRNDLLDVHIPVIVATVNEISEDRRKWVKGQAGNTLLFRAASSFLYFLASPQKRPSSLNEALALREASWKFFEDDEQYEANASRIVDSFRPGAPVTVLVDNSKPIPVPDFVEENQSELEQIEADAEAMLEKNLPALAGFMNGAHYEYIDIPSTEWMQDRARLSASKALLAMRDRCQQDVLFIGGKWKAAVAAKNDKIRQHWESEGFFAKQDREYCKSVIAQGGYDLDD